MQSETVEKYLKTIYEIQQHDARVTEVNAQIKELKERREIIKAQRDESERRRVQSVAKPTGN